MAQRKPEKPLAVTVSRFCCRRAKAAVRRALDPIALGGDVARDVTRDRSKRDGKDLHRRLRFGGTYIVFERTRAGASAGDA